MLSTEVCLEMKKLNSTAEYHHPASHLLKKVEETLMNQLKSKDQFLWSDQRTTWRVSFPDEDRKDHLEDSYFPYTLFKCMYRMLLLESFAERI